MNRRTHVVLSDHLVKDIDAMNGKRVRALHPFGERERRRRSSSISRKLRLLRAHHLIRKVPGCHRYHLTSGGRKIAAAGIAAANTTVNLLISKVA